MKQEILTIKVDEIYNTIESAFNNDIVIKFEEPIHYQDKVLTDIDYYGYISDKNSNKGVDLEHINNFDILQNILYEIQMQC